MCIDTHKSHVYTKPPTSIPNLRPTAACTSLTPSASISQKLISARSIQSKFPIIRRYKSRNKDQHREPSPVGSAPHCTATNPCPFTASVLIPILSSVIDRRLLIHSPGAVQRSHQKTHRRLQGSFPATGQLPTTVTPPCQDGQPFALSSGFNASHAFAMLADSSWS